MERWVVLCESESPQEHASRENAYFFEGTRGFMQVFSLYYLKGTRGFIQAYEGRVSPGWQRTFEFIFVRLNLIELK